MRDHVSLYIYAWDRHKQDIKLLFLTKKTGILSIPMKPTISWESQLNKKSKNITRIKDAPKSCWATHPKEFLENQSSWMRTIEEFGKELVKDLSHSRPKLIDLLKVFSFFNQHYFSHASFAVQVNLQQLNKLNDNPEFVLLYHKDLKSSKLERYKIFLIIEKLYQCFEGNAKRTCDDLEVTVGASFEEISPNTIFAGDRKTFSVISPSDLFDSPGYTHLDRERLYEEFVQLSFPFRTVVYNDMKSLLTLLGYKGREEGVFRALDEHHCMELDIYQFMMGLTAMDPQTQHGNCPAEFRCRLIFRFYDEDQDGYLSRSELEKMVEEISKLQNQILTSEQIKTNVHNALKVFGVGLSDKVPIVNFLTSVGNLRFRGTSTLFRSSTSIPPVIMDRLKARRALPVTPESENSLFGKHGEQMNMNSVALLQNAAKGINFCQNLQPPDSKDLYLLDNFGFPSSGYSLAEHTVMVRRSGSITKTANLLDMERAGEVGNTGLETLLEDEGSQAGTESVPPKVLKHRVKKQYSAQAFNIKSLPNEILTALRYFEYSLENKPAMNWGAIEKSKLIKYIFTICGSIKDIFESEPRLLHISTPCYILGDLHGNFGDLVCFEKALWRLGPHLTPANFLFLGDYVDRGQFGLEVVIYLFAQKLRSPNRFYLLRGNHEVREIQQCFSFYKECEEKFGEGTGAAVWEEINAVFDRMPLAAVVDRKIFCIHGGVPNLNEPLSRINQIPCPLPNPEIESPLAWQMLWNDPVACDSFNEEIKAQLAANHGFAHNIKRQTAFVFNEEAFDRFLQKNHLTHVIRAHEVKQAGFEIQQKGRLLTVFSSSQYCGMNNEAACILVHDMRIRVIRIDTS